MLPSTFIASWRKVGSRCLLKHAPCIVPLNTPLPYHVSWDAAHSPAPSVLWAAPDQDWSADYKIFSRRPWQAEHLFDPVLEEHLRRYP